MNSTEPASDPQETPFPSKLTREDERAADPSSSSLFPAWLTPTVTILAVQICLAGSVLLWLIVLLVRGLQAGDTVSWTLLLLGCILLWLKGDDGLDMLKETWRKNSSRLPPEPAQRQVLWGVIVGIWGLVLVGLSRGPTAAFPLSGRAFASHNAASQIEAVLKADAQTSSGATTCAAVVQRMYQIDFQSCPIEFQEAYLGHIHAWEKAAELEVELKAYTKEFEDSGLAFALGLSALLGDPIGLVKEAGKIDERFRNRSEAIQSEIRETFQTVERTALRLGATLPHRSENRFQE